VSDDFDNLTNEGEPKKAGRGISLWLAVSLAANALLIGVVGGRIIAKDGNDQQGPAPREFQHEMRDKAMSSIDRERRVELRKAMRQVWKDSRPAREQLNAARDVAVQAVMAEPYDADAVKAALKDLRAAEMELRRYPHDSLADMLADATPEERREVISRFSGVGFSRGKYRDDGSFPPDRGMGGEGPPGPPGGMMDDGMGPPPPPPRELDRED